MTGHERTFSFPDGTRWVLERAPDEAADGSVTFVVTVPAGAFPPPPHIHPLAVDGYEVLEGSFDVSVDGHWRTLSAGDRLEVPPRTVHSVVNRSSATARVRNVHRPACGFDAFVAHADREMRAHRVSTIRDPRVPILFAMLTLAHPDALVPGRARDRLLTHVLAGIGRAFGMAVRPVDPPRRADRGEATPVAPAPQATIINPRTGQRMRFLTQTPELLELESWSPPHSPPEPEHVHPGQVSAVRVVSGALRFEIAGTRHELGPGQSVSIPANTPHTFSNPFGEEAHWIGTFRPALGIAAFFETFFALGRAGRLDERGMPGLLQLAVMLPAFGDEIRPTSPPWPLLRTLAVLLGPVARLRGHRAVWREAARRDAVAA